MVKETKIASKAFKMSVVDKNILDNFASICTIPRESGKEDQVREFLVNWANKNEFSPIVDEIGNLIVKVPASKGMENHETVILQGHLDMVCEKTSDSNHDFMLDPIETFIDGEWLKAKDTTLGADNGIGLAIAMTLVTDSKVPHGPVELLFTIEEETGLVGAKGLEAECLKGKYLINIDSEKDNVFTVGCAGGKDTSIEMDLYYEEVPSDYVGLSIKVSGLAGGHSGENIKDERANAIKILNRLLSAFRDMCDIRLSWIRGGSAHNAIPRDAEAVFYIPGDNIQEIFDFAETFENILSSEFAITDPRMKFFMEELLIPSDRRAMMSYITGKVLDFISAMRHGVAARSAGMLEMVETSSNLAKIYIENGKFCLLSSQRSSVESRLNAITERIETIARVSGAKVNSGNGYPPWTPDFDSFLVKKCKGIYKELFGEEARIETIHAGLECGIIGRIYPEMQMISVGPIIENPHSPEEKLYLPSLSKIYELLAKIMKDI